MAEYHVGCGIMGIYAGTLNKQGNLWTHKSDVTDETISAAAQYLLEHNESFKFNYRGKCYRMAVLEVESEAKDGKDSTSDL